jgi:probable rRNA maturation factor
MIAIQIQNAASDVPVEASRLRTLVLSICKRFGVSQATVSIGIVGDARMQQLNEKHLRHKRNTDCLSFDLSDGAEPGQPRVFELIVNGELAAREAARRQHSAQAELALYIAHALLHQLGFDDATTEQARRMHRMEDEILQHLGYGIVYNTQVRAKQAR